MFDIFLEYDTIVHILHLATLLLFLMKFEKTFLYAEQIFDILNSNNIIMQYIIIIVWKHNTIIKISTVIYFYKI